MFENISMNRVEQEGLFFILFHSFNFVWACPGLNSILGHEFMALIIMGCSTF